MTETTIDDELVVDTDDPDARVGQDERPSRFARTTADTVVDVAVAFICFGAATAWTFDPLRRQFTSGTFANFFELQARAFLDGHLAIEQGLLGIEAFIRDGNEYMYFGPLLSIFRIPFVALSDQVDGRLTVISLLLGTLVLYLQSIKLLDLVLDLVRPTEEPGTLERWIRLAWRASVATGTVVLTLLAIPWSYHEAHLWSAALFIALLNQMLQLARGDGRLWVFGLVLLTVVLNRPTTAYAGLIGVGCLVAIMLARRSAPTRTVAALAGWGVAALLATVSVNWAKFRRPFGIPMEDQFFSKVDANRAQMLEIYDNKYFQFEFMPSNLWAYFKPNGVDISTTFPFIDTPRQVPWVWGDAFYDTTYRTASVTATNPLLFILSIVGSVAFVMLWRRRDTFWTLTPPVVAGLAAAGGVVGWGYMSTRYLTDFLPGMLLLSAIGIAAFLVWVDRRPEPFRPPVVLAAKVVGIALVVWSIVANLAIAFNYSFSVGDSAAEVDRLLEARDTASAIIGPDVEDFAVRMETLPYDRLHPVAPGTLAIIGDCEALYYSNGEPVDTWINVEYGTSDWRRDFEVTPSSDLEPGHEIELVRIAETDDFSNVDQYWFSLVLRVDDVRVDENLLEFSLLMRDNYGQLEVETLDIPLDEASELSVTFDDNRRVFFAELDGLNKLYGHFDMDPLYDAADPGVSFIPDGDYGGFEVTRTTPDTPWCDRLSAATPP